MSLFAKDHPKARACLEAIVDVLKEHGFSLGHEDSQGAFILEGRTDSVSVEMNERWLRDAFVDEGAK